MNKKVFLFLLFFLIPLFSFAQNFGSPGLDSLITDEPIITPMSGGNDANTLIPKDIAPTNTNPTQDPTPTSFTPVSRNENSSGIDTSILNQKTPRQPNIVKSNNILDQITPWTKSVFGDTSNNQPLNKLLNQLFYVGLVIAVILALVMIIRGGVEYMTIDAISSKESGKNRIKAALGGLLLAFSAILILNTINPSLTKLSIVFKPIKEVSQITIDGVAKSVVIGTNLQPSAIKGWSQDENGNFIQKQSDGSIWINTPDGRSLTVYPDGTIKNGFIKPSGGVAPILNGQDEKSVRDYFSQHGIGVNAAAGTTNLQGLGEAAMLGVVNLKNASGAQITITGGTEPGHKTHGVGKSIVDLRKNSTLDSYITSNAVTNYSRGNWTEYKMSDGSTYMNEGDHWHVEYGK